MNAYDRLSTDDRKAMCVVVKSGTLVHHFWGIFCNFWSCVGLESGMDLESESNKEDSTVVAQMEPEMVETNCPTEGAKAVKRIFEPQDSDDSAQKFGCRGIIFNNCTFSGKRWSF